MAKYCRMSFLGDGIPKNLETAKEYVLKAVDKGQEKALNIYGCMLKSGECFPIDKREAFKYFKMAAKKGNIKGMGNFTIFFYVSLIISFSLMIFN